MLRLFLDLSCRLQIEEWIDGQASRFPNLAQVIEVGTSYEGRTIRGLKVTLRENRHTEGKPP